MIDVLHPGEHFAYGSSQRSTPGDGTPEPPQKNEDVDDDDEAAWLQSVQGASSENTTDIKALESGNLVMDVGRLREEPPTSVKKKPSKGRLPS